MNLQKKFISFADYIKSYIKFKIHPFYFYMIILWITSKGAQNILNQNQTVWEIGWKAFLENYGDESFLLYVQGSLTLGAISTIVITGFFSILDFSLSPQALRKYKVQEGTNEPPDTKKFMKAFLVSVMNGVLVAFPSIILFYKYAEHRKIPNVHVLPNFNTNLIDTMMCHIIFEIFFYTSHRLLHTKYFYASVHKIHHEWTSSVSVVAIYCHPFEFLIANMLPLLAGFFILNCHIATIYTWIFFVICTTYGDHSGYHLPFIHSSEFHDIHHRLFNVNYGALGWMDRLFGTDASFKGTIHDIRHQTLFSLESAKERFPDGCEKKKEKKS